MKIMAKWSDGEHSEETFLSGPEVVQKYLDEGWRVFAKEEGVEREITSPDQLPSNCHQSLHSEAAEALKIILLGSDQS